MCIVEGQTEVLFVIVQSASRGCHFPHTLHCVAGGEQQLKLLLESFEIPLQEKLGELEEVLSDYQYGTAGCNVFLPMWRFSSECCVCGLLYTRRAVTQTNACVT